MKMIDERIATLTAEAKDLRKDYKRVEGTTDKRVIEAITFRISMEISFLNKLKESELSCKHSWFRTTKNYKSVKKCVKCGEVKENIHEP